MKKFFLCCFIGILAFLVGTILAGMFTPDKCGGLLIITREAESAAPAEIAKPTFTKPKLRPETDGRTRSLRPQTDPRKVPAGTRRDMRHDMK